MGKSFRMKLVLLLIFLYSIGLSAQSTIPSAEVGTVNGAPFIRNYTPEEYNAHNQNWTAVQDKRGVMYFGNNHGILEYDGVSWRLIPMEIIRSMAIADDGRIYAGSFGDIGYLAPDSAQQLQFISLLPHLDKQYHEFSDVWQTFATSGGIYFVTPKFIFRWDGNFMSVWTSKTSFHVGCKVNDKFYVRQREVGLMHIVSDSLVMAPLGEKFADERVMAMFPFPSANKNLLLMATRTNGLFLYDGNSIQQFSNEANDILKEGQLYCGTQLSNGQYAYGTLQNGVVIIDTLGRLRHHLNKASGLQDETIWYLYPDKQGGLWIGMHVGISRAEISSPLTYFGEREGVEGSVLEIVRHKSRLYAATSMGIYYLDENPINNNSLKFHRVSGVSPQCWALLPFGQVLLAGAFDGVYEIREGQGRLINGTYAMSLSRSMQDSNRVFVGLQSGLKSLYFDKGKWRDEGRIENIDPEILHIQETSERKLWLTARNKGLVLVDFSKGFNSKPQVMSFDTLHGLPPGERKFAFFAGEILRFGTPQGIYGFDEIEQRFYPDTSLIIGNAIDNVELFSINEDSRGILWIVGKGELNNALPQTDGSYAMQPSPFLRIASFDDYYAYPDPIYDNLTWLGSIDRVIRYDGSVSPANVNDFPTLIRQITANGDSLLYGGSGQGLGKILTLGNGYKSLRFRFAAPSFDDESKTQYQYILEGFDAQWSDWNTETYKDYTGLPPGSYRFLVRSKNIYQQTGTPTAVEFKILPPFYLSSLAFLLYALILIALVLALWKMKLARIQKKHYNELKQLEFEKLKELDQLKSRFFADISHEFRTPLTLILGPVENLLSAQPDVEQTRQYHMIRRNAQRLLRLINQLLDLSKLEAGKMKLEVHRGNIILLIKGITHSFESLVQTKKIQLNFRSEVESAFLYFDPDKIEQILTNLISNAVKFTSNEGTVMVDVKMNERDKMLQIDVTDTGSGIPKDQLPHVFDRFYQGSEATRIGETGSGIGLALVKELVELHQGHISVSSVENKGTKFSILLPLKNDRPITDPTKSIENGDQNFIPDVITDDSVVSLIEEPELTSENTLLLVEDNPDMRAFIRETLAGTYQVIEAVDGQDGVEKALEFIPDIIISDVMMPRKDGLQLCEILKNDERTSHIPVILLTAKADIESRLAGLERGADDYLAKPFNRDELLIRSRNLLDVRQRLRQRYASLQPHVPAADKNVQIEDAFLQNIRSLVEKNLSDSDLEIDALSRLVGMSRSQMFRKIKGLTGQSPSLFIRAIRLNRGKELLETTEMNVSEVAYQVGFSTPTYFSDAFTEAYGIRPSQLRK